jgi:hypothetical protein
MKYLPFHGSYLATYIYLVWIEENGAIFGKFCDFLGLNLCKALIFAGNVSLND